MRIKKTSQTTTLPAQVVNTRSESTEDTYSCDYVNNLLYQVSAGTNIDNLTANGTYGIFNATGTLPSGYSSDNNNIFIQNMVWDTDWIVQNFYDIRTNNSYTRRKTNGNWNTWVSLI